MMMIVRLYEDCMGHLHLRLNETLYCNVQEWGHSFLADVSALMQAGNGLSPARGVDYLVLSSMFKRRGGPRLLAMWEDGRVVVFNRPATGDGCRYLSPETSPV